MIATSYKQDAIHRLFLFLLERPFHPLGLQDAVGRPCVQAVVPLHATSKERQRGEEAAS